MILDWDASHEARVWGARAHVMGQGLAVGPCGGQERLPRGRVGLARRKGSGRVFGEAETEFMDRLTYRLATVSGAHHTQRSPC